MATDLFNHPLQATPVLNLVRMLRTHTLDSVFPSLHPGKQSETKTPSKFSLLEEIKKSDLVFQSWSMKNYIYMEA